MDELIKCLMIEDLIGLEEYISVYNYDLTVLNKIYFESFNIKNQSIILSKFFSIFCQKVPLNSDSIYCYYSDDCSCSVFTDNLANVFCKIILDEGFFISKLQLTNILKEQGRNIYNDLLFWSILMNKYRLTEYLWYKNDDFCYRGLFISFLYRIFHLKYKNEILIDLSESFLKKSIEWEERIGKLIAESFKKNTLSTKGFLLNLECKNSFLELMVTSKAINVVSQSSIQITLQELWTYPLQETISNTRVLLSIIFPIFCYHINTFVEHKCLIQEFEVIRDDEYWRRFFNEGSSDEKSCRTCVFCMCCCFLPQSLFRLWKTMQAPIAKFWFHNVNLSRNFAYKCKILIFFFRYPIFFT